MSTTETPTEAPKPEKRKRVRGDAMHRLIKSTASKVIVESDQIADALVSRVIAGDANYARLLLALIERLPSRKRKPRSIALEWIKGGPWRGPVEDTDNGAKKLEMDDELRKELDDALEKYDQAEREIAAARNAPPATVTRP